MKMSEHKDHNGVENLKCKHLNKETDCGHLYCKNSEVRGTSNMGNLIAAFSSNVNLEETSNVTYYGIYIPTDVPVTENNEHQAFNSNSNAYSDSIFLHSKSNLNS
ncbi:unnamed protein product [Timema podura]|uniref:Uncharacterized protein n=1 Tax=Timema podura TaxID=61482 RepID=A0ABN7PC96_TIMPD|nr:unnamed protein product [Timema podura]